MDKQVTHLQITHVPRFYNRGYVSANCINSRYLCIISVKFRKTRAQKKKKKEAKYPINYFLFFTTLKLLGKHDDYMWYNNTDKTFYIINVYQRKSKYPTKAFSMTKSCKSNLRETNCTPFHPSFSPSSTYFQIFPIFPQRYLTKPTLSKLSTVRSKEPWESQWKAHEPLTNDTSLVYVRSWIKGEEEGAKDRNSTPTTTPHGGLRYNYVVFVYCRDGARLIVQLGANSANYSS